MEYILAVISVSSAVYASYLLGKGCADATIGLFKRENERLNAELHKLTDRDERGRFKGNK